MLNVDSKTTNKTTGNIITTVQKGIVLSKSTYKSDTRMCVMKIGSYPQMVWRSSSTTSDDYLSTNSNLLIQAASNIANRIFLDGFLPQQALEYPNDIVVLGGENYDIILGCSSCDGQNSIFLRNGTFGVSNINSLWNENIFTSDTSDLSVCNPNAN